MWDNNQLDQVKKRDMASNMLDNNTMENKREQLQRRHESNAININKGDEENNEENERSVVDTADDNSSVSNITLGNDDLMNNVLDDELNVEEGSTYGTS